MAMKYDVRGSDGGFLKGSFLVPGEFVRPDNDPERAARWDEWQEGLDRFDGVVRKLSGFEAALGELQSAFWFWGYGVDLDFYERHLEWRVSILERGRRALRDRMVARRNSYGDQLPPKRITLGEWSHQPMYSTLAPEDFDAARVQARAQRQTWKDRCLSAAKRGGRAARWLRDRLPIAQRPWEWERGTFDDE